MACGGLPDDQLQTVFTDIYTVTTTIQTKTVIEASSISVAKDPNMSRSEGLWDIGGTLDGGFTWAGEVEVAGTGEYSIDRQDFDLDLKYVDVLATSDLVLNGDINTSWVLEEIDATYRLVYHFTGELDAAGEEASGAAELDYTVTVEVVDKDHEYTIEGEINGEDVSDFDIDRSSICLNGDLCC